eukprot:TRINITY_DN95_c7_g1_i5.p1 TRINITY_DN95_c7_g1~~TRINITY_DN95_c7_g1_i5.p1  ORF type:complete len:510 (-),score=30.70 TRINITY_DN95_c7_g1_i5:22-1551(-)
MFLLVAVCCQVLIAYSRAQNVKDYNFTVAHAIGYPDGYRRRVVTINDQFMGPEIRVQQGDLVRATFTNAFRTDVFTIHWHGLTMQGSQWFDGVHMGTQCPIVEEFTYEFTITQEPGTHFYHAHQGGLRIDGLVGAFIIEDTPQLKQQFGYDEEYTFLLTDWYHADSEEQLSGLDSPVQDTEPYPPYFKWVGDPQSFLINGKGFWNASQDLTTDVYNKSLASFETFQFEYGKKYLFRFISGASLSFSNVWFQNHTMTIIRIDGQLVEPFEVQSLDINAGQRYDVLIDANQPQGYYWIQVETRFRNLVRGWGLIQYRDSSVFSLPTVFNPIDLDTLPPNPQPLFGEPWNPEMLKGVEILKGALAQARPSRTLVVGAVQQPMFLNDKTRFRWAVAIDEDIQDSRTYKHTESPLMNLLQQDQCQYLYPDTIIWPDVCKGQEDIKVGEVIDIVLENFPQAANDAEHHPWHLHGYHFYVLGHGPDSFSKNHSDEEKLQNNRRRRKGKRTNKVNAN